jgi:hypothetical protein
MSGRDVYVTSTLRVNLMKSFPIRLCSAGLGAISVFLTVQTAHAGLTDSIRKTDQANPTTTKNTPVPTAAIPIYRDFQSMPTFSASGIVAAYEDGDDHEIASTEKVQSPFSIIGGTGYLPRTEEDDSFASGRFDDNFALEDSAKSKTKFVGTPDFVTVGLEGAGLSAAIPVLRSITAEMTLELETKQDSNEAFLTTYAFGEIRDPFVFSPLSDGESLLLSPSVQAGMSLSYAQRTPGVAQQRDVVSGYAATLTKSDGGVEELFSLDISVGQSDDGNADIVVDFTSHVIFGLNDAEIEMRFLDSFSFSEAAATSTERAVRSFTLQDDITLFDAALGPDSFGGALRDPFSLAYVSSAALDWNRNDAITYDGSGYRYVRSNDGAGSGTSAVPAPETAVLIASGLFAFRLRSRKPVDAR